MDPSSPRELFQPSLESYGETGPDKSWGFISCCFQVQMLKLKDQL